MGLYTGTDQWVDNIYQFEETDVVQGGPLGIDNVPLKDLADRTTYLRERLGIITRLDGETAKSGGGTITAADEGKLIMAYATGVNTLTIANANTFVHGALIPITSYCNAGCVMNVVGSAGQLFYDSDGWRSVMYMHHKEHLILVALTDHFKVMQACGNFYTAGEEVKGRKELRNTLAMKGQVLQRSQYPRLWEYVSSLPFGYEVVPEWQWPSEDPRYKGFFTTGDGFSTFRLPDERGMFERMVDAGRGFDYNRLNNYPGGFEWDDNKQHSHSFHDRYYVEAESELNKQGIWGGGREYNYENNYGGSGRTDKDNNLALFLYSNTDNTGGNEARPRNIGKLNLIKF